MKQISLNFGWEFHTNKDNVKTLVDIPHPGIVLPINHFESKDLALTSVYERTLIFDKDDLSKHLELLFEGAAHKTKVYLNNELIKTNIGGYTPFKVVIRPNLGNNNLRVEVTSDEDPEIPPFGGVVDYIGYAGLYREVYLIKKPIKNVNDITIRYHDILNNNLVNILVKTNNNQGLMKLELYNKENELINIKKKNIDDYETIFNIEIEDKVLWDLDNPYLYNVKIIYEEAEYKERFGLRASEFKREGYYLNGKLIKLLGLNRHQSYPYYGYAMPKGAQVEDVKLLLDLGLNIVRTAHYPQSKHFLNACDELGLLVFTELPGWQHIGDLEWQKKSIKNVEKMIKRDKNHPSVIIWGVRINESNDNHDFFMETNRVARLLDPTRPTGGVRNMAHSEFLEDVYTFNDFIHEGNNIALSNKKEITKKKNPYLVTEHNGHMFPTKAYDNEIKRVEHALRHLRVINSMKDKNNGVSGAIGWVFSDYQTHEEFGSGDLICHHGVLDIYRNPKFASYVYQAEGSKKPILQVASDMHIGEYAKSDLEKVYVFTNLDYIKLYKNDEYIETFYPDRKTFKHLDHPPIVVDDFIGDLMEKHERLSKKDSKRAKYILRAVQTDGTKFSLKIKLMIFYLFKKYKLTMDEGVALFYKYLSNWGTKQSDYKFEGYKDNKLIKTVTKSIYKEYSYHVTPTRDELTIGNTYDTTRVVIAKLDQNLDPATYSFDPVSIEVTNLELIGPNIQSLNSGMLAVWVKTVKPGKGIIKVTANNQEHIVEVSVNET